jgi:hypothetical protein
LSPKDKGFQKKTFFFFTHVVTIYHDESFDHIHRKNMNNEFVPNDTDCFLSEEDFNIDHFLRSLDEHHSPFTMDLVSTRGALKFRNSRSLDIDVKN